MLREKTQLTIFNILQENNFPKYLSLKLCKIIETSCNNSCIKLADKKNISTYWDDEKFQDLYGQVVYKVLSIMDPNSSVYEDRSDIEANWIISKIKLTAFLHFYKNTSKLKKIYPLSFLETIAEIEELNPFLNYSIRKQLVIRSQQKVKKKTTSMFKCPQCKQRECTYEKKQIRSGDEGMTMFFDCCCCGYHWSQNT